MYCVYTVLKSSSCIMSHCAKPPLFRVVTVKNKFVCEQVDNWVYEEANSTFIDDPDMAKRLMDANPNSFRKLVATFLEANGRGYWEADDDQIQKLRDMYMDVEDKIEGVE